jgi:hypothetical protein
VTATEWRKVVEIRKNRVNISALLTYKYRNVVTDLILYLSHILLHFSSCTLGQEQKEFLPAVETGRLQRRPGGQ